VHTYAQMHPRLLRSVSGRVHEQVAPLADLQPIPSTPSFNFSSVSLGDRDCVETTAPVLWSTGRKVDEHPNTSPMAKHRAKGHGCYNRLTPSLSDVHATYVCALCAIWVCQPRGSSPCKFQIIPLQYNSNAVTHVNLHQYACHELLAFRRLYRCQ
jgi:hypothetical protein